MLAVLAVLAACVLGTRPPCPHGQPLCCRDGAAIQRKGKAGDMLDTLLVRNDTPGAALRTLYDPYNDEELTLSRSELRMLLNIHQGKTPHLEVDPYADHVDWYSNTVDPFPATNAPIPKRRFRPSVWEEQKIVKLVPPPFSTPWP